MPSLRPLLCDAATIIGAYQAGVWDVLVQRYRVAVTGTVAAEAHYYPDAQGRRRLIHLGPQIDSGVIERYDATPEELKAFDDRLEDRMLAASLDDGELEALALLVERPLRHVLCTGDGPAIRALCHLGLPDKAASLERALQGIGNAARLREDLTEQAFRRHHSRGMREREETRFD